MLEGLDWILELDIHITKLDDFAFGYYMGVLTQLAFYIASISKDTKTFQTRLERYKEELKTTPNKKFRQIRTKLKEEEQDEVRDMIKKWVVPFRQKLDKEIIARNTRTKP